MRASTTIRVCSGDSQEHRDAVALVEYLMDQGGSSPLSNPELAVELRFIRRHGSRLDADMGRFYRARNHVKDRVWPDSGDPCCGYVLHYRYIKDNPQLALVDPTGDIGEHATAAIESIRGWVTREQQHQTENQRQINTLERLAEHALSRGDREGHRICTRAAAMLEENGTISGRHLAELELWAATL